MPAVSAARTGPAPPPAGHAAGQLPGQRAQFRVAHLPGPRRDALEPVSQSHGSSPHSPNTLSCPRPRDELATRAEAIGTAGATTCTGAASTVGAEP